MGFISLIQDIVKLMKQQYPEVAGYTYKIKAERWDKNLAYGFTVWEHHPATSTYTPISMFKEFDLPINPSNLSVSIPFAINVMATTRGILEEHNGVVFRNITISGTTGVAVGKRKGGYEGGGGAFGFIKSAFSNTVNRLDQLQQKVNSLGGLLGGSQPPFPPLQSAINSDDYEDLGYAKLHKLLNYFVAYAQAKTGEYSIQNHSALRLVFYNRKDNVSYVVTPLSFDVSKSSESPHIYNYRITLKAWALAEGTLTYKDRSTFDFSPRSPSVLQRMVNILRGARSVLSASSDTVRAVALDFNNAYAIVGEAMLVLKEAANLKNTVADFPNLMKDQWKRIAKDFKQKAQDIQDTLDGQPSSQTTENVRDGIAFVLPSATDENDSDPTNASGGPVAGKSDEENNNNQHRKDTKNPFNNVNDNIKNTDLLDLYSLNELVLNHIQQQQIRDKIDAARRLTISDWDVRRRKIEEVRDTYADSRGLSDASYDAVAGRTSTQGLVREATSKDFTILKALNDVITAIDTINATNDIVGTSLPDPFARARAIVGDSGITINTPTAAMAVPFPYGSSLETMAATYLGDPDRWVEIAILNDLKAPFIDETGFIYNFTTSGNGNTFTTSSATNLFPSQEVFLSSSSQREEKRRIVKISEFGLNNFLVTVDGDADLDKFTAAQGAKMRTYLPNTVNSTMIILVPAAPSGDILNNTTAGDNLSDTRALPITMNLNQQQKVMGVDIALTDSFDLAMKSDSDVALSVSLANAVQAIKLKLATERGQLKHHQEYGSGLPIGERMQYTAVDLKAMVEEAIMADPRFEAVPEISVTFDGPVVSVNVTVSLVNQGGVIPIEFQI